MGDKLKISRHKRGDYFIYNQSGSAIKDKKLISWIESLAIPPAWKEVKISQSSQSKIFATGYDKAGRLQAMYNPSFREKQERLKFAKILRFAKALPKLRQRVHKDLKQSNLTEEKVLACIIKLIDTAYFRVGNEKYAQENGSYGITTLRSKHLDVTGDTVTFEFIGKSGQEHIKQIIDKQVASILKRLDDMPGYEVFRYRGVDGKMHDIHSSNVNRYIKESMGEDFTAKDFRTWGGTLLAATELMAVKYFDDKKERKKMVTKVVKNVAKRLGNTPAIARSSYIDPRVVAAYVDSSGMSRMKETMDKMKPRKYMSRDELCVLKLLS